MKLSKLLTIVVAITMPLSSFAIDIQSWTLDNGAKVLFVERNEVPIVDVSVSFDAGNRRDNPNKIGVADLTAALMDTGAGKLDEEAINTKISDLAVNVGSSAGQERAGVGLRSLTKNSTLKPTLSLANLILTQPNFDEKIIAREKERAILGLKQGETQPGFLMSRAFTKLNYPNHPYGYSAKTTVESIQAINRQDLVDFHQQYYRTPYATITIVGDVSRNKANSIAKDLLKGLPTDAEPLPAIVKIEETKGQTEVVKHPASQSSIAMGYPVITIDDPDYFALVVGNYILGGGGFDSRLMKVLRDEKGYVYGVNSSFSPSQEKGIFSIGLKTKQSSRDLAMKAAKSVLQDFISNGPNEEELKQAKANIVGGFPLRIDTNSKVSGYLSVIGNYQLPLDYLDTYPQEVEKITIADIKNAWQRRIKLDDLNIVYTAN